MGKLFNAMLIACALAISTEAQSDWVRIDPNSPLAGKAVSRARTEFEQSGLDTTGYSMNVGWLDHSILVTFYDPLTFRPYIDPPPSTGDHPVFHVKLDETATQVLDTWIYSHP